MKIIKRKKKSTDHIYSIIAQQYELVELYTHIIEEDMKENVKQRS